MSKITVHLKSVCAMTIHDAKGRSYRLKRGDNHLELEHSDYLELAKSLGVPVNKLSSECNTREDLKEDVETCTEAIDSAIDNNDNSHVESDTVSSDDVDTCSNTQICDDSIDLQDEDDSSNNINNSESVEDACDSYSDLSYNELKELYKKITGDNCRLKKSAIIAFLQEHKDV